MTSEILVMNKSCVAMAADSAATTYFRGGIKTFRVDKIFPLSFHQPVGIMFYNIADMTGFPLDVLVKEFSNKLGTKKYETIEEYAEMFFQFINCGQIDGSSQEKVEIITKEATSKRICVHMAILCNEIFHEFTNKTAKRIEEKYDSNNGTVEEIVNQCRRGVVSQILSDISKKLLPIDESTLNSAIKDLDEIADLEKEIDRLPDEILKRDLRKRVKEVKRILANMLLTNGFEEEYTGVVVTGYGRNEFFPSYVHYKIFGYFFGELRYVKVGEKFSINEEKSARIEVFAQGDVAESIIFGISKEFRDDLMEGFGQALDMITESIVEAFDGDEKQKKKFIEGNKTIMSGMVKDVERHLDREYKEPAEIAVQFLSKEEIGAFAESLINITSLRRRVSMDPETVGGPTDVAIISRGEGFIWVKRKHYFNTELNPYYVNRRGSERNENKEQS